MYRRYLRLLLSLAAVAAPASPARAATSPSLSYAIDLNDRADDLFKVTLTVEGLGPSNEIYQFASTAPGTYQVMNIGRFVRSFEALDSAGGDGPREADLGEPVEAGRSGAGPNHPLSDRRDVGYQGRAEPGLPHVRDLDRGETTC